MITYEPHEIGNMNKDFRIRIAKLINMSDEEKHEQWMNEERF